MRATGERGIPPTLAVTARGRDVRPKTDGQRALVGAIDANTLTFAIGPAGTGKTFLAIVMAVRALKNRDVSRIVLSRPAVEAGEKLGFLPGDFREKVDPYLRPLYDALAELLEPATTEKYLERGTIEVAPLAYMRGRTLSDAFVIFDEAQNATHEQLKMFVTRLGANSKMVVTGDDTQIDLPRGMRSGILDVERLSPTSRTSASFVWTRTTSCAIRSSAGSSRRTIVSRASAEADAAAARGAGMIYVDNRTRGTGLDAAALARVLERLLAEIGENGTSVSLTLVRDRAMRELNREHRGKDAPTDVLSFPLHAPEAFERVPRTRPLATGGSSEPERMLGDIVVSVDTARRQAADYDATLEREVQRLLIHAVLHLAGHDHMEPGERAVMEAEERRLAESIAMPWPYLESPAP